jgi:hypothetical protein
MSSKLAELRQLRPAVVVAVAPARVFVLLKTSRRRRGYLLMYCPHACPSKQKHRPAHHVPGDGQSLPRFGDQSQAIHFQ